MINSNDAILHARFVDVMLPKIETHARIWFRGTRCRDHRDDKIAECIALGWRWFIRLAQRGKDATKFPKAFTSLLAKAVNSGRLLCGMIRAKDVLNTQAQQRHGFKVEVLPTSIAMSREHLYGDVDGQRRHDVYEERLHDNTHSPPDEQAQFRIDFKDWLRSLTPRERRIIREMARNERTKDLSKRFELSPSRISQMRSEFKDDWRRFIGELPPREAAKETAA